MASTNLLFFVLPPPTDQAGRIATPRSVSEAGNNISKCMCRTAAHDGVDRRGTLQPPRTNLKQNTLCEAVCQI